MPNTPTTTPENPANPIPEADFAAAQTLFSQWLDLAYTTVANQILSYPEELRTLRIFTHNGTDEFDVDTFMKGADPAEWRGSIYLLPTLRLRQTMTPEELTAWREAVNTWIQKTLEPVHELLDALGVNDYMFEGLNVIEHGLEFTIEPYEDAAIVQNVRRILGLPVLYSMQPTTAGKEMLETNAPSAPT